MYTIDGSQRTVDDDNAADEYLAVLFERPPFCEVGRVNDMLYQ